MEERRARLTLKDGSVSGAVSGFWASSACALPTRRAAAATALNFMTGYGALRRCGCRWELGGDEVKVAWWVEERKDANGPALREG